MQSERIERLAEYLCSEFDFSLNPCVGYSWPEHENDDGYRGDGSYVKLQPSDVQASARENAKRILAFLEREATLSAAEPVPCEGCDGYNCDDGCAYPTPASKPVAEEYPHPEWIWYCESNNGPMVTFGRWAKNPQQRRYKLAEIQPTKHDQPAPSVAVKAGEAMAKLQRALDAANPNHKTMWVYVDDLRSTLSAQVQDDDDNRVAISLGAAVLSKIVDPAARETAIRNALIAASNRSGQVQDIAVAEIVSAHGDPEAFGERELVALIDIQKFPYRTKLYAAAPTKEARPWPR